MGVHLGSPAMCLTTGVTNGCFSEMLRSISTPDRLESRLGALEFVDGVPSGETGESVYDHLDFMHALNVYPQRLRGGVDVRDPQGLPRGGSARTTRS